MARGSKRKVLEQIGSKAKKGSKERRKKKARQDEEQEDEAPCWNVEQDDEERLPAIHAPSALEPSAQRWRLKNLQKLLEQVGASLPAADKRPVLCEMAHLKLLAGDVSAAAAAVGEAVALFPQDKEFLRLSLLSLLVESGKFTEAETLLQGALFEPLLSKKLTGDDSEAPSSKAQERSQLAASLGHYTLALTAYRSAAAQKEAKPKLGGHAVQRLKRAYASNPFIAEYLAFAPAFDCHFKDFAPSLEETPVYELPLVHALEYCKDLRQCQAWLVSGADARTFLRRELFEEEPEDGDPDAPPLPPLPGASHEGDGDEEGGGEDPSSKGDSPLRQRWARARAESLELWATELLGAGDSGGLGQEAVDDGVDQDSDDEGSESSSAAFAAAEERMCGM